MNAGFNDYDKYDFLKHYKATIIIYKDKEKQVPNTEVGPIVMGIHIGSGVEEREEEQLKEVLKIVSDKTVILLEERGYPYSAFDVKLEKVVKKAA